MNVFSFNGNLGRDVEVRQAGGSTVANFVVAVKAGYGEREQTLWLDCALWGKRAEGGLVQYLTKGQQVCVTGELGTRKYEKDGAEQTVLTINVNDVALVGGKTEGRAQQPAQQQQQPARQQQPAQQQSPAGNCQPAPNLDDFSDDIPF